MDAVQHAVVVPAFSVGPTRATDGARFLARSQQVVLPMRAAVCRSRCPGSSSVASSSFRSNVLRSRVPMGKSVKKTCLKGHVVAKMDTPAGGYASALAETAEGAGVLENVYKDVENLSDLLSKNAELFDFIVSPVVVDESKKSILKTISEDAKYHEYTLTFLSILVDKKRINLVKDIIKEFEGIYNDLTDTQLATVSSAVKIEHSQLALIARKIQSLSGAKNIRLKNVIDPSLIAGFIIKYGKDGSRFIDMSVKGQLDRLAAQFEYAEKVGAY